MKRSYRMYGLVPYNISPIQQGIQFGHAVVEYGISHSNSKEYYQWSRMDKTFIILNGGTTNTSIHNYGSLNSYDDLLACNGITRSKFFEPDLGDQLTAIVFLVDDRVWDREQWPDFSGGWYSNSVGTYPDPERYKQWKSRFSDNEEEIEKIIFLREFLPKLKLA